MEFLLSMISKWSKFLNSHGIASLDYVNGILPPWNSEIKSLDDIKLLEIEEKTSSDVVSSHQGAHERMKTDLREIESLFWVEKNTRIINLFHFLF